MILKKIGVGALKEVSDKVTSIIRQLDEWADTINTEEEGVWETWAVTDRNNITVGNGTEVARYRVIRGTCFFEYTLIAGSTTAIGDSTRIGLPIKENTSIYAQRTNIAVGPCSLLDSNTANQYAGWTVMNRGLAGTSTVGTHWNDGSAVASLTFPITEASGDVLNIKGSYEIAE